MEKNNVKSSILSCMTPFLRNVVYEVLHGNLIALIKEEIVLFGLCRQLKHDNKLDVDHQKTILFLPRFPAWNSVMYKICRILGCKICNNPDRKYDVVFNWPGCTYGKCDDVMKDLAQDHYVINKGCNDISKVNVDRVFTEVYGYSSLLDPLTHHGECVRKSDENAAHDGKILQCPIEKKEEGFIYQKLINNQFDSEFTRDLRVVIIKNQIPRVSKIYRSIDDRFDHFKKEEIVNAEEMLSSDEIKKIMMFCERFGLEHGELDILRDTDGRIYIVDVNNSPWGGAYRVAEKKRREHLKCLALCFYEEFLKMER